ncbi:MAG: corrinoid protein [Endomicrobia bacterium]|nr:corrinoid protein [Endomicrobiia bacterium]
MTTLQQLQEIIITGKSNDVEITINHLLSSGISAQQILNEGLLKGMQIVGEKFKSGEIFIPEVLVAAKTMKTAMNILRPYFVKTNINKYGKFIIGAVKNDFHDIGTTLVAIMFEGNGFSVKHLGMNVSPEKFIEEIKTEQPDIVGLSALLTTTMQNIKLTINEIVKAGIRDKVIIMVGGAPVTQEFADEVGADGYAPDAVSAVEKAKELLKLKKGVVQ